MSETPVDLDRVRINEHDRDAHPAVVISCEEDCRDPEFLRMNVLYGLKKPPAANLEPWQGVLNGADGLDFRTVVDCGNFYLVNKSVWPSAIGAWAWNVVA